ncbi:YbaL family putative K(+) efflux transporter [Niveispirillum sp.]|uniref:YbaL family putative K(+) efflux transporter n=1 Tax=Niveispirillum sp. TaxID=1917217 RepID=UPI001B61A8B7|nr:YbaL family putative K(+) efflux transporter [Niveispirillum sp.]MBP7334681.1 Kef family K(+) transporter [Niveispirillum sp.]
MHDVPLITMIVAALALAFIFGAIAQKLKISPLVGYLLAGVMIGPGTPGYVADMNLAPQLAEIGVILLMFGVGLHFSVKDLMSVKGIAIPGAIGQIGIATLMGMGLSWALGWTLGAGLVFGLALSVASTVVLLRALQERRLVESKRGRIAIGWLIVEDLAMVLALVLLPALAGLLGDKAGADGAEAVTLTGTQLLTVVAITLGKVAAFVALMLVVGKRVIPWVLHEIAHTGSRELFRLAVLAIALGVAYGAAELFGVSFALGAFFAGMVLSGSPLSHRAAEESLPLRDAFAVLFFVSVGMMFDPAILLQRPVPVLATLLIIVLGKSVAAYLIVLAFGHPRSTALTISASLAQIGEFSFILAALGVNLGLLPQEGQDLVLVGAILSILLNPVMFSLIDKFGHKLEPGGVDPATLAVAVEPTREPIPPTSLSGHAVIIGHGRVGSLISARLQEEGVPYLVVEDNQKRIDTLRAAGVEVVVGNAVLPEVLSALNLPAARLMFIAIPGSFEAGQIIRQTRVANPGLPIIARAHADEEVVYLTQNGASTVVMGERETARGMIAEGLASMRPPPAASALAEIEAAPAPDRPAQAGGPDTPAPQPL